MTRFAIAAAFVALAATMNAQIPDFTPGTRLIGALMHNDRAEAARLLVEGADPDEGQFGGMPPLLLATARQDIELVRLMAAKGANLDARDRSGATALMWATFNDTGDARMVEALIQLGADPLAANKSGETALDWALRRGETPVVATLRKSGASSIARTRAAAEKALVLLQQSGAQFSRVSKCYSCHHQALPQMAFAIARTRGLPLDEPLAAQQVVDATTQLEPVIADALQNRDRIPNPAISVSYTLAALAAADHPADEVTTALTEIISAWQKEDGSFHTLPAIRPPLESSEVTATALSLRAMMRYGSDQRERIDRAAQWLRSVKPATTEEAAMQVLGLTWADAKAETVRKKAEALLSLQRQDGGWGQLPALETDAYATGQALVALEAAGWSVSSQEYQRGIGFLMRTQFPDGSWLVRTRTYPVQMPKDSGFPHGRNQWISAAGTSWATMALLLALPSPSRELPADAADGFRRHTEVGRQHPLRHPARN
jgi:hypothetical protein